MINTGHAEAYRLLAVGHDSAPKYDFSSSVPGGICLDILRSLAETVRDHGISIVLPTKPLPTKRALKDVETGRADIFCGADKTKNRIDRYKFSSQPLYEVSNIVVKRSADIGFPTSYRDLADESFIVGSLHGNASSRILKEQLDALPGARVNDAFKTVSDGLDAVEEGRIRNFFYHDLGLLYHLKMGQRSLAPVKTKFRSYSHYMLFNQDMPDTVVEALDKGLNDLHNTGQIERILTAYRMS